MIYFCTARDQGTARDQATARDQGNSRDQGIARDQTTASDQGTTRDQGTGRDQGTANDGWGRVASPGSISPGYFLHYRVDQVTFFRNLQSVSKKCKKMFARLTSFKKTHPTIKHLQIYNLCDANFFIGLLSLKCHFQQNTLYKTKYSRGIKMMTMHVRRYNNLSYLKKQFTLHKIYKFHGFL